jgi:hypothetical protein
MTLRRKAVISAGALLALVLLAVILAPILLRGPIETRVKQAIAANVDARVDWRDLDLGLLRSFPNLSLQLKDLSVAGINHFAGDTLLAVPRFRVILDLSSVIGGLRGSQPLVVRSIELHRPSAKLLVQADGRANWRILKPRDPAADKSGRAVDVSLKRFNISDAAIAFDNERSDLHARIAGLDHSLSGDFGEQRFALQTQTRADTATLSFAGVPYLSRVRIQGDVDFDADMATRTFTLRDAQLRVNDLLLNAAGSIASGQDDVALDLRFHSPRTEFGEILSLVPAVFMQDYEKLRTAGTMSVDGRVRGRYGKSAFPAFVVQTIVANGSFQYPDLPLAARDINLRARLTNAGGTVDNTVLNVERFHMVLGRDRIDGSLVLRTPVSDPAVALRVAGRLDLANVPRTVKLTTVQQLSGLVTANAAMRARLSDVNQKRYDNVDASGRVEVRQLAVNASNLRQPINIHEAVLRLTPSHAELSSFRGRAGSSEIAMKGSLENVLGFALGREDLRGDATITSTRFDLNEWRSNEGLKEILVPGRIDFTLRADADTVNYGNLALRNARGVLHIKNQRVTLEDFTMNLLGGALTMKGFYETQPNQRPAFDFALDAASIDAQAAFAGIRTVQAFAPVARYAQGDVSAELKLAGELGANMLPVFTNLTGLGSLFTSGISLRDFPALDRLADALKLDQLRDPGFVDLKSSFAIEKGRLHVRPFDVNVGAIKMTVAGSNGIDQSLDYTLALRLPRSVLGSETNRAVTGIINRSQQAGFNLGAVETITLGAKLGGTITNPTLTTSFRDAAGDAGANITNALREEAARRQEAVIERVDSAAEAAKRRVIAEAEAQATRLREEAKAVADRMRREGYERADSLENKASGLARIATQAAANRLRKETDAKADAIMREADTRATALVAEARQRASLTDQR